MSGLVERNQAVDGQLLGNIFYGVSTISPRPPAADHGDSRYSRSQIALSSRIEEARVEMAKLSREKSPDFDRIDKLEERSTGMSASIAIARRRSPMWRNTVLLENAPIPVAQMLGSIGRTDA